MEDMEQLEQPIPTLESRLPKIVEEVWQASFAKDAKSIHSTSWPEAKSLATVPIKYVTS